MRTPYGPLLGTAALVVSLGALTPPACSIDCYDDADCGPPFFRCLQNTCVECLVKADCEQLFGEERHCWHGKCCSLEDRGCFDRYPFPSKGCIIDHDCTMAYGFNVAESPNPGGSCTDDLDCPEASVCDNEDLRQNGEFASPPPFARGDNTCRFPIYPFCREEQCSECRTAQDCFYLYGESTSLSCCSVNSTGGSSCIAPDPVSGCD